MPNLNPEQTPPLELNFNIVTGAEITDDQIAEFNRVWRIAFRKDKDVLTRENIDPRDIHFFMSDLNNEPQLAAAIGRLRRIEGIKIGDKIYQEPVWGRADIGVSAERGKGYGKALILKMIDYAKENGMKSCVGFHGKMTTLSEFYAKCGLVIDYDLGNRIYRPKDGELIVMDNINVSHFPDDPFIEAVKASKDRVVLPFSW